MTAKILVSACLLGQPVRYDGRASHASADVIARWRDEERIVAICPEVSGGLGVPRPAAEISGGVGADVLDDRAKVVTRAGHDVTPAFRAGAEAALQLAEKHGIEIALLKERSPSCGHRQVYDGTFTGTLREGPGVTAALLREHGVRVFGESEIELADAALRALDRT